MFRRVSPTALALLLGGLPAAAQTTLAEYPGQPSAYLSNVVGGHDLNFDGVPDLVTGARFDNSAGTDAGAVYARSGATGAVLWFRYGAAAGDHYGCALAMSPDLDGDGVWDVVVGAQSAGGGDGAVYLLSGLSGATRATFPGVDPGGALGMSVAADFDHDRDGVPDIAGGAPFAGKVRAWSGLNGAQILVGAGSVFLGVSLLGGADPNGDGYHDLLIADLQSVLSASTLNTYSFPSAAGLTLGLAGDGDGDGLEEVLVGDSRYDGAFTDTGAVWVLELESQTSNLVAEGAVQKEQLGAAVAGLGDVDGDGWEDWALAATGGVTNSGHVRVVSGRFQQELYRVSGSPATGFPTDVAAAGDVNGDGFLDYAVADPTAGVSDDGIVAVFSAYGPGFVNYCTPGTSASGCRSTLSATGTPSAFVPNPFVLSASNVEGNVPGLFFYGWNGRQANPWGNGSSYQCVTPPVKRAGLLSKTGTSGQCDGAFSQDLNAHWNGNAGKNPGPGTVCQAQLWYRDPFNTSNQTTSLSDAIEFYVDF